MVEAVKYTPEHKADWDAFVAGSKNGTFLLHRAYMAYHADRFTDHSLLFYRKNRLIALLPANEAGQQVQSHGGLTYGGIISDSRMKTPVMLEVFEAMLACFREQGFRKIIYKTIPPIYHQLPAGEDLYALFRHGATLYRRDASSVIDLAQPALYDRQRRWEVKKARQAAVQVVVSEDYNRFMQLEQELLQAKYGKQPVHTAAEVTLLASRFPQNIKLYIATKGEAMLAGVLLYETATVAHCQYMGATAAGKASGALDVLIDHLLTVVYPHKKYFNFGISTEDQGKYLNEGLIRNKESYGARTVVHDFYEIAL
ncbi:GNAT family N-acetyltransferase [Pontibacter russatus]|uniref:GNAT family N-acetyltransferase n=1 Tax=Pontibacter russatus TaxID=2694929 RepID=UPI001379B59D|nr:GNAT family N-acetyltransferase [Pontibacter russatus]